MPLSIVPSSCVTLATEPDENAVAVVTSELQKLSPFAVLEDGSEQQGHGAGQGTEGLGGPAEVRSVRSLHLCCTTGAPAASGPPRTGSNDVALDYEPYYGPAPEYYSGLAKEQSLESQDSSTLSSSSSEGPALLGARGPAGAVAPDSLFQFSIGKILEDEGTAGNSRVQGGDHDLLGFYEGATYAEGSSADRGSQEPTQLHPPDGAEPETLLTEPRQIRRSVWKSNGFWARSRTCSCKPVVLSAGSSCPSTTSGTTVTTLRSWSGPGP